jgi:hypothetical protein
MPLLMRRKALFVLLLVVFANAADLVSTFLASPDLADEWNILQRHFGLGWSGLIVAKLIGGSLAYAGYVYYLRHRDHCYPGPGLDAAGFRRHFSFGRQATPGEMWSGIPVGRHLGVNLGYFWTGMQGLVLWVAVDNLLLRKGIVFPLRQWSEMAYHLFQSGIVALIVLWRFYASNYRRYRVLTGANIYQPIRQTDESAGAALVAPSPAI